MKTAKTHYFIEVDGIVSLEPHPGPRDAAFRAALEHAHGATDIRIIVIEGDDPFSDKAKRSFYQYDPEDRRWILRGG